MPDRVKLTEHALSYTIDGFFGDMVEAGFTKPILEGSPEDDMPRVLSIRAFAEDIYCVKNFLGFQGGSGIALKRTAQDGFNIDTHSALPLIVNPARALKGATRQDPESQESSLWGRDIAYMHQVHGADVKIIDKPGRYECDGLFSSSRNIVQIVKTADCLPILLFSEKENVAGAIHMGWRSAREGILDHIPYDLATFKVIAGPGLRRCCYEVGAEFCGYDSFKKYVKNKKEKFIFDSLSFTKDSLMVKGLKEENFLDIDICTYCSPLKLHSHRKTSTKNRILNFIRIK